MKSEINGYYCPEIECRWNSYYSYKLIIWAWMMNEISIVFSPSEVSHNGFYVYAVIQILGVIFIGIPLVYSEICLAQYTNCNVISMWNFFPILRSVGYATVFLIILKTIYAIVLSSWYLEYTFYAVMDPPPWLSCDEFNDTKCMVKRVNVSVFQHCLEAQILFEDDCGMKTASNCFFEREIGDNNTLKSVHCIHPWKIIVATCSIGITIFLLSIKKERFLPVFVKLQAVYVCILIFVLFCVALSTSGTWYATNITVNWTSYAYSYTNTFNTLTRGLLSTGTGCGIILFLSRDVSFRSPATMTSITTPLFSLFFSQMFALIGFGGIKTMSYYHGEEENVIELGASCFFTIFASISEIMTYFDAMPVWGFFWFSIIFLCLYSVVWILYLFLRELLFQIKLARKYNNISSLLLMIALCILALPFFCSDLTEALSDAVELIQITNCFIFSISLYWVYGFQNHNNDITFMIGVKASYFWKLTWLFSPIFLLVLLYYRWQDWNVEEYNNSFFIQNMLISCDVLLVYLFLAIYFSIIFFGILFQLIFYYRNGKIRKVCSSFEDWGPRDLLLFRSRKMFVPEIMTREFLYRQVRIHGFSRKHKVISKQKVHAKKEQSSSSINMETEWSALTSN